MSKKESRILSALMIFSVVLAFAAGYLFNDFLERRSDAFPILAQAHEILLQHGYAPAPEDPALEYGMIRGMISAYEDPFTSFYEPVQNELQTDDLQGVYGGIGVSFERNSDGQVLLYPFPESPARAAGIQDADILTMVDDKPVTEEMAVDAITAAIRGPEGTMVAITIVRLPGGEPRTFEIERVPVPLPSVTWKLAPDSPTIGLIEVNLIADNTPDEINTAAEDLARQGAEFFVVDLRDNGGGLLKAGIDCARLFLTDGVVIQQQYRGQDVVTFEVEEPGPLAELPLVIWVNQYTASAAEIFAGALQLQQRAPLIGTHTFGKDAIQLVFDLQDSSSIHVTAAKWWLPGLDFPNEGVGLLPDKDTGGSQDAFLAETRLFFGLSD